MRDNITFRMQAQGGRQHSDRPEPQGTNPLWRTGRTRRRRGTWGTLITTITTNTAVDVATILDSLAVGGVNRSSEAAMHPGGKGVNAARAAVRLGGAVQTALDRLQFCSYNNIWLVDSKVLIPKSKVGKYGVLYPYQR